MALEPQTGRIDRIVTGGFGLLRTDQGVIFCRNTIPGESVRVNSWHRRRGVGWADDIELLEPSPSRVESVCSFFPRCGGCDFMHMNYSDELRFKRETVLDTLNRLGVRDVEVAEYDPAFLERGPLEYRNTVRLKAAPEGFGYYEKESNKIVVVDDCPISDPEIRDSIRELATAAPSTEQGEMKIRASNIKEEEDQSAESSSESVQVFEVSGKRLQVSLDSFFQANLFGLELVVADIRVRAGGGRLIDLFAGVGTFSVTLADLFGEVIGFEISKPALADFRKNAPKGVRIANWDAGKGLKRELETDDTVIVDPPRTGLPRRLREDLARSAPRRLFYLSCDVASFARDALELIAAGYRFTEPIRLYDMFPRTAHVELLGVLEKR